MTFNLFSLIGKGFGEPIEVEEEINEEDEEERKTNPLR
jgi:hypothetical protein